MASPRLAGTESFVQSLLMPIQEAAVELQCNTRMKHDHSVDLSRDEWLTLKWIWDSPGLGQGNVLDCKI